MNRLPSLLNRPAEVNKKPWITVILCTVMTFILLTILETAVFRSNSADQICLFIGLLLIAFTSSTLFFVIIPSVFLGYFSKPKWTFGKMYAYWGLFMLASSLWVFTYEYWIVGNGALSIYWTDDPVRRLSIDILYVVLISLLPLWVSYRISMNRNQQSRQNFAKELNLSLEGRMLSQIDRSELVLEGTGNESVVLDPNTILYIESSGCYVSIAYRAQGINQNRLLRCTIKQLEDSLLPYSVFVRCHRAYIVNANKISRITATVQGYKLSLYDTLEVIPVSEDYLEEIQELL